MDGYYQCVFHGVCIVVIIQWSIKTSKMFLGNMLSTDWQRLIVVNDDI